MVSGVGDHLNSPVPLQLSEIMSTSLTRCGQRRQWTDSQYDDEIPIGRDERKQHPPRHGRVRDISNGVDELDFEVEWMGYRYAGRSGGTGPFEERREFGAFGDLGAIEFTGIDLTDDGRPDDSRYAFDYCIGGGWTADKCSEPLMVFDFERDMGGRISERSTIYGFPNGEIRDGSDREETAYFYSQDGRLMDVVSDGELGELVYEDDLTFHRDEYVGSVTAIDDSTNDQAFAASRLPDGRAEVFVGQDFEWSVDHDSIGQITKLGEAGFEYDEWRMLDVVHGGNTEDNGEYKESYLYDYRGRLVAVIDGDETFDIWLHDGPNPIERWEVPTMEGNGEEWLVDEYVWGPETNQMFAAIPQEADGHILYPMSDERQSISGIWSETEVEVVEYRQYDTDGRMRIRDQNDDILCDERDFEGEDCHSEWLSRFGYTGAFRSTGSGMYHFGVRWYSSQIGQFTSPDPLWYVDSHDLYAYAGFDPVNAWDPLGMAAASLGVRLEVDPGYASDPKNEERVTERYPGPGMWLFDFGNLLEDAADALGEKNREITERGAEHFAQRAVEADTWRGRAGFGLGLWYFSLWSIASPQTGDEVMLSGALGSGVSSIGRPLITGIGRFSSFGRGLQSRIGRLHRDQRGGVGNVPPGRERVREVQGLPSDARLLTDESEVFRSLERHQGIPQETASRRLHQIKDDFGGMRGYGEDHGVVFDATGNVYHPTTGEWMGTLTAGGAP